MLVEQVIVMKTLVAPWTREEYATPISLPLLHNVGESVVTVHVQSVRKAHLTYGTLNQPAFNSAISVLLFAEHVGQLPVAFHVHQAIKRHFAGITCSIFDVWLLVLLACHGQVNMHDFIIVADHNGIISQVDCGVIGEVNDCFVLHHAQGLSGEQFCEQTDVMLPL